MLGQLTLLVAAAQAMCALTRNEEVLQQLHEAERELFNSRWIALREYVRKAHPGDKINEYFRRRVVSAWGPKCMGLSDRPDKCEAFKTKYKGYLNRGQLLEQSVNVCEWSDDAPVGTSKIWYLVIVGAIIALFFAISTLGVFSGGDGIAKSC